MADNFDRYAILESFLDEVSAYLPEIETNLDRLQQSPGDARALEETYRRTHTIGGSAAMMEFTALAHVSQGMEETLGDALDRNAPLDAPTIAMLRRSYGRLARLVEHVRSGADDTPLVAEDDADRSAWRGPVAAPGAAFPQASAPPHGQSDAAGVATGIPSSVQLPDWLAAFAQPGSSPLGNEPERGGSSGSLGRMNLDGLGASSTPAPWSAPQPQQTFDNQPDPFAWANGDASSPAFPQPPADPYAASNGRGPEQWGASLTGQPTGAMPAMPIPPAGAPIWAHPTGQPAVQPGPGRGEPSFDEMMQSFGAGGYQQGAPTGGQQGWGGAAPVAEPWQASSSAGMGPMDPSAMGTAALPTVSQMPPTPRPPAAPPAGASSQWGWGAAQPPPPAPPWEQSAGWPVVPSPATAPVGLQPMGQGQPLSPTQIVAATQTQGLPATTLDELRVDEEAVRRQVGALREVVTELRDAAQAMEDERGELRTFLDGSRDALERLEEWAGQQMGLDLRRSPESVRRYLPLSVIWVTTTRLKNLVGLLHSSSRKLTANQEQIDEALGELRGAIGAIGNLGVAAPLLPPGSGALDQGFSATIATFNWAPSQAGERVVESTQPVPAIPSAPQAPLPPGARAEMERTVREELRRALEDEVRDEISAEVRREEEQRIRHEIEIQVRRQLLADLAPGLGSSAITMRDGEVQVLPQMPFTERTSRATQITSEQSPEALEVFRDEAQEHLQTITNGIAQLEATPGDVGALRSIRRAMHTLKGAAGMMGFAVIQHVAHASEDLLEGLTDGGISFTPVVHSLILDTSEVLDQLVAGAVVSPEEQRSVARDLIERYRTIPGMAEIVEGSSLAAGLADLSEEGGGEHAGLSERISFEADEENAAAPVAGESGDLSVRLQLSKLDDLVNLFGEVLINRSILEERVERLNHLVSDSVRVSERLQEVGSQLESGFEASTLPSGRTTSTMLGNNPANRGGSGWASNLGNLFGGASRASSHAGEFDELELDRYTEFHRLSRGLSEGVADAVTLSHEVETLVREVQTSFGREKRLSSDFQDRLLKARLVPLQSLVPRLYRAARASALRQAKEVEFFVVGTETEVDRKVFEEVEGPLLHLVRNAVTHGIETPEQRELAGKSRTGKITVLAAYEGNQVVISVRDDGAGIDPESIRASAASHNWIDTYAHLTEKEAIDLIFRPGFSTAASLTEESGRGVGLDVVRDVVTRMRGTVEVDSVVGQGSTFTMKFPISLQIARAVLTRVGPQTLAIPMVVVSQIGRLDYYLRVPGPTPAVEVRGERYPLVHLGAYLQVTPAPIDERSPVLLVNAGKHRVALLVDEVISQQEVVSKPLGPHLRDVRGVAGATVLGNGQVVLILELNELLAQQPRVPLTLPERSATPTASRLPTHPMPAVGAPPAASRELPPMQSAGPTDRIASAQRGGMDSAPINTAPSSRGFVVAPRAPTATPTGAPPRWAMPQGGRTSYLLVVDDSPSVRRVVSNMLKSNGWTVQTARDGVEALDVIARERPAAILLDIEMPRMDGYELMATVRSQEQYRTLPLIVLTSRAATKHQQRAIQLGADAYIVKPYRDDELLTTVSSLVQERSS